MSLCRVDHSSPCMVICWAKCRLLRERHFIRLEIHITYHMQGRLVCVHLLACTLETSFFRARNNRSYPGTFVAFVWSLALVKGLPQLRLKSPHADLTRNRFTWSLPTCLSVLYFCDDAFVLGPAANTVDLQRCRWAMMCWQIALSWTRVKAFYIKKLPVIMERVIY